MRTGRGELGFRSGKSESGLSDDGEEDVVSCGVTELQVSGQSREVNDAIERRRVSTSLLSQEDRAMVGSAARFEE